MGTINLDIDSEPFFERAMAAAHIRGEADDTEGRLFSNVGSSSEPVSNSSTPAKPLRSPVTSNNSDWKLRAKARRRAQLAKQLLLYPNLPPKYRPRLGLLRHFAKVDFTQSNLRSEDLPSAKGCWVGKQLLNIDKRLPTRLNLRKRGIKPFFWDGV